MVGRWSFGRLAGLGKQKVTRRERFLGEMQAAVPWARLVALIEPFYPQGKRGRPPLGVGLRLRVYFLQQWYALADEALEDAIHDSRATRAFIGGEVVPDATPLLGFRHLLEEHDLTQKPFAEINAVLSERGAFLREGTIVDATIIAAAPSTKDKSKERDPEMHQTKKGQRLALRHEGAHRRGPGHGSRPHGRRHGSQCGGGGAGSRVAPRRRETRPGRPRATRESKSAPRCPRALPTYAGWWQLGAARSKAMAEGKIKDLTLAVEKTKAQMRALVEHPFHVLRNLFGHRKARYRGLAKNTAQLPSLFALANLVLVDRILHTEAQG